MGLAAGGAAIIGGVVQAISGSKQVKKTQEAIQGYKRQVFSNAYGDMTVSKLGAQLQIEELARATSTSVQALRSGGVRGVIGGVGSVQEQNVTASRAIGADLDRQKQAIAQLRASDEVTIRGLQEDREIADLQGLGNELNTQRQNVAGGINNAISGAGTILGGLGSLGAVKGAAGAVGAQNKVFSDTQLGSIFAAKNPILNTPTLPFGK